MLEGCGASMTVINMPEFGAATGRGGRVQRRGPRTHR